MEDWIWFTTVEAERLKQTHGRRTHVSRIAYQHSTTRSSRRGQLLQGQAATNVYLYRSLSLQSQETQHRVSHVPLSVQDANNRRAVQPRQATQAGAPPAQSLNPDPKTLRQNVNGTHQRQPMTTSFHDSSFRVNYQISRKKDRPVQLFDEHPA